MMKLIRYVNDLHKHFPNGSAVTIGNFDGLHLGHQAIFQRLNQKAKAFGMKSVVMTFEPLPREYFLKDRAPSRLTRFREKYLWMQQYKMDYMLCLHFNRKLAELSAADFVQRILIEGLNTRYLLVGKDFRFGHQKEGNLDFLQKQSGRWNVEVASDVLVDNERVSSTRVREVLKASSFEKAHALLGRPYSIIGKVVRGDQRARTWGVPTANLNMRSSVFPTVLPVQGVYVVEVLGIEGEKTVPGVANVGCRPTVDGFRQLLEVHLLNFDQNIYGKHIEVVFLKKLRDEKRFDSVTALKEQILCDVEDAKDYFLKNIS